MTAMQTVLNITLFSGKYLWDEVYAIPIKCRIMIQRSYTFNGL